MGVDALDIGIKLKILKKQGKPSTQRWLLGELRKDGLWNPSNVPPKRRQLHRQGRPGRGRRLRKLRRKLRLNHRPARVSSARIVAAGLNNEAFLGRHLYRRRAH